MIPERQHDFLRGALLGSSLTGLAVCAAVGLLKFPPAGGIIMSVASLPTLALTIALSLKRDRDRLSQDSGLARLQRARKDRQTKPTQTQNK